MKEYLFEIPVLWYCEECLQRLSFTRQGSVNVHQMPDTDTKGIFSEVELPSSDNVMKPPVLHKALGYKAAKKLVTSKGAVELEPRSRATIGAPPPLPGRGSTTITRLISHENYELSQPNKRPSDVYKHKSSECTMAKQNIIKDNDEKSEKMKISGLTKTLCEDCP